MMTPITYCLHTIHPVAETWRRVWGDGKIFRGAQEDFFLKKFPFPRQKFLMTFFHRPGFSNFPSHFPDFPDLYFVRCRTQPFPHKKNTFFPILAARNFFLVSLSHNTTSQNIGGRMHGPFPHLKLWGTVPPVPLGFRPCIHPFTPCIHTRMLFFTFRFVLS